MLSINYLLILRDVNFRGKEHDFLLYNTIQSVVKICMRYSSIWAWTTNNFTCDTNKTLL